ncbi:hypothetical protein CK203_091322 [Vitis vinifera]|uniref:Uncharacterized protein n=1 Tax=Vitis vinifera TaxID=29760 RepID=A0A438CLP7_VITVI|nr:hypothetical protein CK203_091322 [Vitis vinifera]
MEIPHEDQSSHYDHEKDKFANLSMRDRIELGKRQVQQSQWGSKYALNGDDSYEHTVGECPTIPTVRDMYGYQSSYTSSWNNHPNLTTQPQPQPSMSTSSLEQAILKISKVMEDFVGEQQKINSHLNEKIDNLESSINVRMEGVYNDLSLRIEKVQDSIEKLTNLDIARGKRKLPPQPHHNLQGTNAKRSRKVLKIDTLVGDCYDNSMDQPSIENHKGEFSMKWVCMMLAKIEVVVKTRENRGEKPRLSNFRTTLPVVRKFRTTLPIVRKFRTTHPLCEFAFVPIFKKCMLSVPSQNLSANFTGMRTLCEFVFVTKFQNHALYFGEPQECEIFAQHIVLCETRTTPPLCEFLSFFIPTLPNPKPLSLVLNCSKWFNLLNSKSTSHEDSYALALMQIGNLRIGSSRWGCNYGDACFPNRALKWYIVCKKWTSGSAPKVRKKTEAAVLFASLLHCSFLAYFERLWQRAMKLQSLVLHEFELPKALP